MEKVNLAQAFARFSDHWAPKIAGQVDDYEIKLVKIQGEFVWHAHDAEDELFLVIDGDMTIRLRDGEIKLGAGEFFVVPRGVEHMPVAERECRILLFERTGVVNTGNAGESDRTVRKPERI